MALEALAGWLLKQIDADDAAVEAALPGDLADGLPDRAAETPSDARPADSTEDSASDSPTETAPRDGPTPTPPEPSESTASGSRLRRAAPYLAALLAGIAAFGLVIGLVRVARGWLEELRTGHTPIDGDVPTPEMEAPDGPGDDAVADQPSIQQRPSDERVDRLPAREAPSETVADGDVLAAMAGLAFHTVVDRMARESDPEGTMVPVEAED